MITPYEILKDTLEPLKNYLLNDYIQEIMINSPDNIWIEEKGIQKKTDALISFDMLMASMELLARVSNQELSLRSPLLEARLEDGSRVAGAIPPVSESPILSIRKFSKFNPTLEDYGLSENVIKFFQNMIVGKNNFLIAGGTSSGKAQPIDSLVYTPDGFKRMGDIKKSDIVSTPDNKTTTVIDIFPQGILPIYQITFKDGRMAEASGDHLWEVYIDYSKKKEITTALLKRIISKQTKEVFIQIFNPAKKHGKIKLVAVKSIEFSRYAEAQCILLGSPEHLYITDNYIVTHNTTFFNAVLKELDKSDRIIVIEDTKELKIDSPNIARLEAQANLEINVSQRDLVKLSLRLRPDKIILGEVRDASAYDLLAALNTGHSGGSTIHANSAKEALTRLETLVLQAQVGWPYEAIKKFIADTINFVIYLERNKQGQRNIKEIKKITGYNGDYILEDI